ncbi:MAG: hypothetical protein KC978_11035 [Candidatus Omnitrophica bacterium]|nr:hypothetical protein [Candidatus Omnitrophota bacterium]
MSEFTFRTGEELTLWVKDRSSLSAFYAINAFQKALSQVGVHCILRGCARLSEHSLCLTKGQTPKFEIPSPPNPSEGFQMIVESRDGIFLGSGSKRGLTYAVWHLMESLGWSWPTPSLERTPEKTLWSLPDQSITELPALTHRIVFLEEVRVNPQILLWLSRQRFNTLFPSNPTRFSEPENQFSDACMIRARELGLDFIIGGSWWDWFGGGRSTIEKGDPEKWIPSVRDRALEIWDGMGEPSPRLSLWPLDQGDATHLRLLEAVGSASETLRFETTATDCLPDSIVARTLFQWDEGHQGSEARGERYLVLNSFSDNGCVGYALSPILWIWMMNRIHDCVHEGLSGVSLGFKNLPLSRFLESSAFAVGLLGRGMWSGAKSVEPVVLKKALEDQFDTAGGVVGRLIEDLGVWISESDLGQTNGSPLDPEDIEMATDILRTERLRDKLDERISEIEESPPSEPSLELARNLTTLVHLFDLEESEDVHEKTATARTIWKKNEIDNWPDWLQRKSPLVERLLPFL